LISGGDGATVIRLKVTEGLQKTFFNKKRTGMKIHSSSLLKTNVVSYCKRPTLTRNISSKALNNIEIYKEAYNIIKSKPGNMTPGSDNQTIDGMSIVKLENLKDDVISWKYNCKPTKRIFIPKANGKLRPLGIPSIMDKILQVAIK